MRKSADMCTKLPNNALEERLRWVIPIIQKDVKLIDVAKVFYGSQRTLERWVSAYRKSGEDGLIPRSTKPKTQPDETPIRIKERIIELRKETRLCAKKLNYKLKKENINIHNRTIGKIIKQEGLTRKYRTRKLKYKYIKVPLAKGDLVEVDIKYVPDLIENKRYYQFTAIDCASRWRYLEIYDDFGNGSAINFLNKLIDVADFRIRAIKTDNGSSFTNRYTGYLKSSDPLNPRLHSFDVERSHRTDQEMFYDRHKFKTVLSLKQAIREWNEQYNNLEHCALNGLTPNEVLLNN